MTPIDFREAIHQAYIARKNIMSVRLLATANQIDYAIGTNENAYSFEENTDLDTIYCGNYNGGCCVVFPGDVSVCNLTFKKDTLGLDILNAVKNYLATLQVNASILGNDLMIDDYKVGSYAQSQLTESFWETVVHISINVDLDIINKVCTKTQNKIPKGLSDYGITTETILNIVNDVLDGENHSN